MEKTHKRVKRSVGRPQGQEVTDEKEKKNARKYSSVVNYLSSMLQVLGSIPTWEREGVLGYDCTDQAHEEIHSSQLFP